MCVPRPTADLAGVVPVAATPFTEAGLAGELQPLALRWGR